MAIIFNDKIEAICLTIGQNFLHKIYPGGEPKVRHYLEHMNDGDQFNWMQFCGSGLPTKEITLCYVVWGGKVRYRCDIKEFIGGCTGEFSDGGVIRSFKNRNLCVLQGPTIPAPYDIPMKGFQGFRYSPFLF